MFFFVAFGTAFSVAHALENGVGRTPPMGWNNWNSLGCEVSETLLLDTSDHLVHLGLRDLGYNYVVLDDCWQAIPGRDEDGKLLADSTKFPHGMKWLSNKVHDKGLRYGMYSTAGHLTCARYEGSLDHEKEDAETFAQWGVDYLKYDNCYNRGRHGTPKLSYDRFDTMWQAIEATGRPILYSLCSWGQDWVHLWGASISNSWRMSGDIYDYFTRPDDLCACSDMTDPQCIAPGTHCSVLNIINRVASFSDKAEKGAWNDMDMLEVGNGGMSDSEYVAHFSMWAALKSPLMLGADLRGLDARSLSIINNPAVIAVSQDPLGKSAHRIFRDTNVPKDQYGEGEVQVWSGPLYPSDQLVVFLNAADEDQEISVDLADLFSSQTGATRNKLAALDWDLYDLWAGRMDVERAQAIVDASHASRISSEAATWYNATRISFKEGLQSGDERLLGEKVTTKLITDGKVTVKVSRHAVKMYRMRSLSGARVSSVQMHRDEL